MSVWPATSVNGGQRSAGRIPNNIACRQGCKSSRSHYHTCNCPKFQLDRMSGRSSNPPNLTSRSSLNVSSLPPLAPPPSVHLYLAFSNFHLKSRLARSCSLGNIPGPFQAFCSTTYYLLCSKTCHNTVYLFIYAPVSSTECVSFLEPSLSPITKSDNELVLDSI